MRFLHYLFSMNELNADPDQQELAQLFIGYAENRKPWEDIFTFLEKHPWPRAERENRIVHALSTVKVYRVDLYPIAKELGQLIIIGAREPTLPSNAGRQSALTARWNALATSRRKIDVCGIVNS